MNLGHKINPNMSSSTLWHSLRRGGHLCRGVSDALCTDDMVLRLWAPPRSIAVPSDLQTHTHSCRLARVCCAVGSRSGQKRISESAEHTHVGSTCVCTRSLCFMCKQNDDCETTTALSFLGVSFADTVPEPFPGGEADTGTTEHGIEGIRPHDPVSSDKPAPCPSDGCFDRWWVAGSWETVKKRKRFQRTNEPHPRAQNDSSAAFPGGPCTPQLERLFYTA